MANSHTEIEILLGKSHDGCAGPRMGPDGRYVWDDPHIDYQELLDPKTGKKPIKDGDCRIVAVPGGISRACGCCNEFERESDKVCCFSCGTCEYVESKGKLKKQSRKES